MVPYVGPYLYHVWYLPDTDVTESIRGGGGGEGGSSTESLSLASIDSALLFFGCEMVLWGELIKSTNLY